MTSLLITLLASLSPASARSPELTCAAERIEQAHRTVGHAKRISAGWRIEKGNRTVGFVKRRGDRYAIESSSTATLGWLDGDAIEKPNLATWTRLDAVRRLVATSCTDPVAAGIWVLRQEGRF